MKLKLDLRSFAKAIVQLENSLVYCQSDLITQDPNLALQLRAAAIQAFEFSYELSWKMLKRYLEMTEPNASAIDAMSFSDLIRTGNEKGLLLSNLKTWSIYRESRNITSHAYDEDKAKLVFVKIPLFLQDAKYLLKSLQERIES